MKEEGQTFDGSLTRHTEPRLSQVSVSLSESMEGGGEALRPVQREPCWQMPP